MNELTRRSAAADSERRPQVVRGAPHNDEMRLEVARLIEHLRSQLEELDRREANLNRQLVSLDNERRALRLTGQQAEEIVEQRTRELAAREESVGSREAACERRSAELTSQERELARGRTALEADRTNFRDELIRGFADERRELDERTGELRTQAAALGEQQAAATQQSVDLDKRTRFHEQHLEKLRREIAAQRADLEQQRQRHRSWSQQVDESIAFRLAHMRRFRSLLDQRERSFEKEAELLREQREAGERELARHREELAAERVVLARDVETQRAEFQSQQDLLATHTENLEGRRQRLDRLRDELEQSHQEALEMRMAVEQASAEVARTDGAEAAHERVQQARTNLFEYYRDLRESLTRRRQEAQDALRELQQVRDAFQSERDEQLQRISDREDVVVRRERGHAERLAAAAAREAEWQSARDRWREDKLEAERVIRELLHQLEGNAFQAPEASPWARAIVPLPPDDDDAAPGWYPEQSHPADESAAA